jgi:chorismate mutase
MALSTIGRIIETGAGDWAAWREVLNLIERRRKLVESEGKRRMQMQDMTDNAEVIKVLDRLADAVLRHVHDPAVLRAIQAEISALLGSGALRGAAGSDE